MNKRITGPRYPSHDRPPVAVPVPAAAPVWPGVVVVCVTFAISFLGTLLLLWAK